MKDKLNRRNFVRATSVAGAGLAFGLPQITHGAGSETAKPALLGGPKAQTGGFPGWPVFDQTEEKALLGTLHSGQWYRGSGKTYANFQDDAATLTTPQQRLATYC